VTWDASYFADDDTPVHISAYYSPSTIPVFDSVQVAAGQGYFPFEVTDFYLQGRDTKALRFTLTYTDTSGNDKILNGPAVNAVRASISVALPDPNAGGGGRSTGSTVGIAVGVVVGLLVLAAVGYCLWRRNRDRLVFGAIRRRSSQGYGVGKSRAQRVAESNKGIGGPGIQLDDSPTSPRAPGGTNVFREEIRRQETGRGY
jgi:hypothetical protein